MVNFKQLYKENKKTFWKFAGVNIFVVLISVGLMVLMVSVFGIHYLISYFVSGAVGFFFNYSLSKGWVFRE